jgi:hypothetical protein
LGAGDREFESLYPDKKTIDGKAVLLTGESKISPFFILVPIVQNNSKQFKGDAKRGYFLGDIVTPQSM